MSICPSCGQECPAGSRFCNSCGAELAAVEPVAREYRKVVTVLFCDIVGSTELGESVDPEALRTHLARYFDAMKVVVERHGGTVEKFIGDAVMAVFGVPQVHEDDALRAVRAAVEMRDALPELGVQARIGLNTGEVVVGTEERLATGDAVNVAARLEQAAGAGEVLLGPETAALVRDAVETEDVTLELKGKSEPLTAHRLLALHEQAPAFARRLDAPLVGRERELRRLQEAFEQAVEDRSCQLFTILGTAGVGKSRLTAEFLGSLEDATVVRGRCLPYGEGITYWPVIEILKQLPPTTGLGLEPAAVAALESVLGAGDEVASEEIPWAVRKLLETAAQSSPIVVVFDDIHWGEPAFLDLLEHVADLTRDAPLLLLCLARPELLDRRANWGGGKLNATTLLLEPLSSTETEELLERLLGEADLSEDLRERIRAAAEGNPLFVEEMVAYVEASGDGEVSVPGTIQALLAARLDQLEPAERGVLERGSVEGRTFHRGAVQALGPEERQVETRLDGLVRKELVRPDKPQLRGEDAYRFRHLLIRDAAYEALPKATRGELHERFAAWLEEYGAELVELDEILGYHLEQAHRYRAELGDGPLSDELGRRAARRLTAAAQRSLAVGDVSASAKLFGRAISLSEPTDRDGVEMLLELAFSLLHLGDFAQTRARYEEAIALAERLGDRPLELRAQCYLYDLRVTADQSLTAEEALELGHAAVRELEPLGDDRALAAAWKLVSAAENLQAHWQGVESAIEHVLEHSRRAGDLFRESEALPALGVAFFWGPTPVSVGLPRAEALLESARGRKTLESWLARPVAGFYGMQGRFDESRALLGQARATMDDMGRELESKVLAFWSGPLEMLAGDPAAAEREYRAACEYLVAIGEKGWLSTMSGVWAEALYELDRLDEARTAAHLSRDAATRDDANAQAFWRWAEAKLLAREGWFDEAEALAREAIAFSDRSDELDNSARVRLGLVEVYRLAGRNEDAIEVLDDAIARYQRKGNEVMTKRSRALRAELGAR
jgi:class 3 adenylate cyclase/tetratricopeptide (TPR) repeat protein